MTAGKPPSQPLDDRAERDQSLSEPSNGSWLLAEFDRATAHLTGCAPVVGCGCSCHRWPNVKHFVACCDAPPYKEPKPVTAPLLDTDVHALLEEPHDRRWTLQGFGMLRTYLDDEEVHRLHIWDPAAAFAEVSTIHDHAWDFTSRIISGYLRNQRYTLPVEREVDQDDDLVLYQHALIRAGEGGGILEVQEPALLRAQPAEHYKAGESYSQVSTEIHESFPAPGTTTIISRSFHENRDLAHVYWRDGDWVTAEPHPATEREVARFCDLALSRWTGPS